MFLQRLTSAASPSEPAAVFICQPNQEKDHPSFLVSGKPHQLAACACCGELVAAMRERS